MSSTEAAAPAVRIAVAGAAGRMGRCLIEALQDQNDLHLAAALDQPESPGIGHDAAAFLGRRCGVVIESGIAAALARADVLIDFTRPQGTMVHVDACVAAGVKLVIGTTGFSAEQKARMADAAGSIAIMMAPNMSVGVNVMMRLLQVAATALHQGYDIEILEAHHRHKVDAPSGTALAMGETIAAALGRELNDCAVYARQGHTGERDPSAIGFATVRGGDIVGDHTVLFAGTGERIEITHRASSRATYAQGALRAARFLAQRAHGLFDMNDVLGLPKAA